MSLSDSPLHIQTPLLFREKEGIQFGFKMEGLQPSGSFKLRGVGHACQTYATRGAKHFWASSGGNAGLAVAYAGKQLNIPVSVVVPKTTSERAKQLILSQNATVLVHGESWDEAHLYTQTQVGENAAYIHPFDDPLLWEGHASLINEVIKNGFMPDAVVVSVGGGGLLGGVLLGLANNRLSHLPVYAIETEGSDCLAQALKQGKPVKLEKLNSIATSLGAKQVSSQVFEWVTQKPVYSVRVTDQTALSACYSFLDDFRLLVEPACGAALSPFYSFSEPSFERLKQHKKILIVACGGVGISLEQLNLYSKQLRSLTEPSL